MRHPPAGARNAVWSSRYQARDGRVIHRELQQVIRAAIGKRSSNVPCSSTVAKLLTSSVPSDGWIGRRGGGPPDSVQLQADSDRLRIEGRRRLNDFPGDAQTAVGNRVRAVLATVGETTP